MVEPAALQALSLIGLASVGPRTANDVGDLAARFIPCSTRTSCGNPITVVRGSSLASCCAKDELPPVALLQIASVISSPSNPALVSLWANSFASYEVQTAVWIRTVISRSPSPSRSLVPCALTITWPSSERSGENSVNHDQRCYVLRAPPRHLFTLTMPSSFPPPRTVVESFAGGFLASSLWLRESSGWVASLPWFRH